MVFMVEQFAQAWGALGISPLHLPDFSPDTLPGLNPSESTTVTLLSQQVKRLVSVSHELRRVSCSLETICVENEAVMEGLYEISSPIANLPLPTFARQATQELAALQASIRNLSHQVSAPAPAPSPAPFQAPAPTRQGPMAPSPVPSWKGQERARAPASPTTPNAEDAKYLIPFYVTRVGKAFGDAERYAKLFTHFYEAGEFHWGACDVVAFTLVNLHPDHTPSHSYVQAASCSDSGSKAQKPEKPSPQQVASRVAPPVKMGPPSLPGAQ